MHVPDRTYDPIRFHRGTRGSAAFVTGLNGAVVLGATLFVVPALGLDHAIASTAIILGLAAGIGHFVAIAGLVRGRRWGAALIGYLAAAGIGLAGFGALAAATGLDAFATDRSTAFGFFAWMIGAWLVATRFALAPFTFTPQAHRLMARVPRPAPDARPQTGARKARQVVDGSLRPVSLRPAAPARRSRPTAGGLALYPISTPTA